MFGNALLFLSNPFFNDCYRVDASITVNGVLEKLKTVQGYLFNDEGKPMFDFEPLMFIHMSNNDCRDRCFAIYDPTGKDKQQFFNVELSSVENCNYLREVLQYLEGLRITANLNSIYTIYFD